MHAKRNFRRSRFRKTTFEIDPGMTHRKEERPPQLRRPFLFLAALLFLSAQDREEADEGLDTAVEVRDVELFVRGVEVVVGKTHAHHYGRNLQFVLEIRDDG